MKIATKYQGEINVDDCDIIEFPYGLPGFLHEKQFVVSPFSENTPFFILQSANTPSLAFVIADPFIFFNHYHFDLPDSVAEQLEIKTGNDVSVYVVLTLGDPFEKTTANLKAPLVIHYGARKGRQLVLDASAYETKHFLVTPAPNGTEAERC
ncbi:MAG TPA: flagellar assembly protein FliW [Bacillales bacterium]|nr:flagellar assembly protein FliW [Bacillales bacterium]